MATRKKIAILYEYNENWIGGTYYIQNLIAALNTIEDSKKPDITILCPEKKQFDDLVKVIHYPYIHHEKLLLDLTIFERIINKLTRITLSKNVIFGYHSSKKFDLVFPVMYEAHVQYFKNIKHHIYWIPDFQEYHLPEFTTKEDIAARKHYQSIVLAKAKNIIFSSKSAQDDFNTIYPANKLAQYLLPFAVSNSQALITTGEEVSERYKLNAEFFLCSNQFWKHKNHKVVLEAVHSLKQRGIKVRVLFTGKAHDHRNPGYFDEVMAMVTTLGIGDNVEFLGFIARADQLSLMRQALAVIQPSLFEGWSTVVEDVKSLNAKIIVSALDVHIEQLRDYNKCSFFPPTNYEALAGRMEEAIKHADKFADAKVYPYSKDINKFADNFIDIINAVV